MRYRSKQPFFLAKDFEAQIVAKNKRSWICRSVIESLSGRELEYAIALHAEPDVARLCCQQALEYPDTKRTAGAKHPKVREGNVVMSTDFAVYRSASGIEAPTAVAVKKQGDQILPGANGQAGGSAK